MKHQKIDRRLFFTGLIATVLLIYACERVDDHHHHDDDHDHDHEYHSVTYWGDEFEVLFTFEAHSSRIEGTAYLSDRNNRPVTPDIIELQLLDSDGGNLDSGEFETSDEGQFHFELNHDGSDEFTISGEFSGEELSANFETNRFDTGDDPGRYGVHFSKERQWLVNIASGESQYRPVFASFSAPGKARVDKSYYTEITTPVSGHLDSGEHGGLVVEEGEIVSAGDKLALVAPGLNITGSWLDRQIDYYQAREEMERAERLREDDAISSREYEMRRRQYEAQQYVFDHYLEHAADQHINLDSNYVELLAPFDGVVGSVDVNTGSSVDEGQQLITLFDADQLWLDLKAYPDDIETMEDIRAVSWKTGNSGDRHHLENDLIRQTTTAGSSEDGIRQTLHIQPEAGATGILPNRNISARVYHSDPEEVLAVPSSAIFDQDAYKVVFVQTQGDRFDKRIVETGHSYNGWTEIRDGLHEDERVATEGVYAVFLEAGNVEIGDSHDH